MNPHEEWRPIRGYEGRYEVSSLGRVRSLPRGTPGACFKKISAVCLGKRPRHLGYQWRYISGDSQ